MDFNLYNCPKFSCEWGKPIDKDDLLNQEITYMFDRTQSMFEYGGLPDTIPQDMLEMQNQINGFTVWTKVKGELYALFGGLGGKPDPYFRPTLAVVSNPALNFSSTLTIGTDCVLMKNDTFLRGMIPLFRKYGRLLTENYVSMMIASINLRMSSLISAQDDRTRIAAEKYLQDIQRGVLGVVGESAFLDGVKAQPLSTTGNNSITQLIELHQYLKAGWFNDLGLESNYNMKRESINSDEAQLNSDSLLPFADNMLSCRKKALEDINSMFGTNITVEFSSSWKKRHEIEMATPKEEDSAPSGKEENEDDASETAE